MHKSGLSVIYCTKIAWLSLALCMVTAAPTADDPQTTTHHTPEGQRTTHPTPEGLSTTRPTPEGGMSPWLQDEDNTDSVEELSTLRPATDTKDGKVFFALIQITPSDCVPTSSTNRVGTCFSKADCKSRAGISLGTCASGLGVCCLLQKTCAASSGTNNTYFVSPSYPSLDTGVGACILTVNRLSTNICQLRLDFLQMTLAEPNIDGVCTSDFLTVTGGTSSLPMICGINTGQHMYVDLEPDGGAVKLTVDRSGTSAGRVWNIKITQIACDSRYKAPSSCLQYFTETSGTVSSFNFAQTAPTTPMGTRELANMDYGVCVQMGDGYCGITWERNVTGGAYGFTVSGNVDVLDPMLLGLAAASSTGVSCTTDYVVIPAGVDDTLLQNDRFCGLGFPNSVTSTSKPFMLFVKTNGDEDGDTDNRGFSLNYRQTTTC